MTKEELKITLEENGFSAENIEKIQNKYDVEKITEIVDGCSSPKEAFEAIHNAYPDIAVEELKKTCDFTMEQIAAAMKEKKPEGLVELTMDELENVAGGGVFDAIGDFFKNNWKKILIGAAIVVGVAALGAVTFGVGMAGMGALMAVVEGGMAVGAAAAAGGTVGVSVGAVIGGILGICCAVGSRDQYGN